MGKRNSQKDKQKKTNLGKAKITAVQQQEQQEKKKKFSKLAFALIIIGVVLMVCSAGFYTAAPNVYQLMQAACYFLVCLGGVTFALTSRFEEDKQKQNNIKLLGLIFIIVAGGRLLTIFFHAMF